LTEHVSFIVLIAKHDKRPRYWRWSGGCLAALRAADLGARTALVTRTEFAGMAAPVRTLAHAARLIREVRQLGQYGIKVSQPVLHYHRLLARVREVVDDVRAHSSLRFEDPMS
jgi:dihydrolipoamide dehydrogenase